MALIIGLVNMDNGLSVSNSYARIDTINGSKNELTLSLNYYLNQQSFNDGKSYLVQEQYKFVPSIEDDSDNYHKQGYVYLKTLPEFANVIDA